MKMIEMLADASWFNTNLIMLVAAVGLAVTAYLYYRIQSMAVEDAAAKRIAQAIYQGAMTFLREEYRIILTVVALITGGLWL